MKHKVWPISLSILIVLLLSAAVAMASISEAPSLDTQTAPAIQIETSPASAIHSRAATTFTTVITVDTTVDTSYDLKYTCNFTSGALFFPPGDGICSFRRALVEASGRPKTDRPILITFNIPTTDTNYNPITGTWTIVMEDDYSSGAGEAIIQSALDNPKNEDSYITIDGNLQPGGRTDGYPKIVINSENSFDLVGVSHNTIRNLAFNGGGGVFINDVGGGVGGGADNLVENVWVGLNADGTEIVPGSNPNISLAGGGIDIQGDNNTISGTTVTGSNIGIRIQGDGNIIKYNQIGTRADGTVPGSRLLCDAPGSVYDPTQWYGGWGVQFLSGSSNQIISNTIAGIHTPHSPTETFPPAIWTGGDSNLFRYNTIGIDSAAAEVGVCGQGIYVQGHNIQIWDNTIVNARGSFFEGSPPELTEGAIYINDGSPQARKVTVRRNTVRDSTTKVIEFGPAIPASLRLFEPPELIIISDTLVVGETQPGYNCYNCLVDFYLDDLDDEQDALQLLTTTVIATGTTRFTATIPSALSAGQGIRVTATTQDSNIIGDQIDGYFLAGTTTKMSPAYGPDAVFSRDLAPGWNLFSFDVMPASNAITDVLSSLSGQYDVVLGYEGGPLGGGRTYEPGNPASDLLTMDYLHGYWINITAGTTQTLTLDYDPARNSSEITLYEGWNLVGYLPDRTWPVSVALQSIAGSYDLVQAYDGSGQTYMPGEPGFSDLTEMKPGFGYWIKIKEFAGTQTLVYPPYYAPKKPNEPQPGIAAAQGVAATHFFTPTTEWADFYGVATLGGQSVPGNAEILAYDPDGVLAGAFTVHTAGLYGFLHVYGDDPNTPADEGAEAGDILTFTIADRPAVPLQGKTLLWNGRGEVSNINISAQIPYSFTTVWADFYGSVTVEGNPAQAGTLVAAYDAQGVYIGDFRLTKTGSYGFLHAYGDDPNTPADEGADINDAVTFRIWLPDGSGPFEALPESGVPTWQGMGSRTLVNLISSGVAAGAPANVSIEGPTVGMPATPYTFTITVNPVNVATPISYTITRTDSGTPVTASLGRQVTYSNVQWVTTGTKVITVVADNGLGVVSGTHTIEISADGANKVYLPLVIK